MLNLPDDLKALFKSDSVKKNLRLHFTDDSIEDITNENVESESLTFTESINSQDEFTFGTAERSKIEVKVHDQKNLKNKEFYASIEVPYDYTKEDSYISKQEQLINIVNTSMNVITTHVRLTIALNILNTNDNVYTDGLGFDLTFGIADGTGNIVANMVTATRTKNGRRITYTRYNGGSYNIVTTGQAYEESTADIFGNIHAVGNDIKLYNVNRSTGLLGSSMSIPYTKKYILITTEADIPIGYSICIYQPYRRGRIFVDGSTELYYGDFTYNLVVQDGLDEPEIQDYNTKTKKNYGKKYSPIVINPTVSRASLNGNILGVEKWHDATYASVQWTEKSTKADPAASTHRVKCGNYEDFFLGSYYPVYYITPSPTSKTDTNLDLSFELTTTPLVYPIWFSENSKKPMAMIHNVPSNGYASTASKILPIGRTMNWSDISNFDDYIWQLENTIILNAYRGNCYIGLNEPHLEIDPSLIYGASTNEFTSLVPFDGSSVVNLSFITGDFKNVGPNSHAGGSQITISESDRQKMIANANSYIRVYDSDKKIKWAFDINKILYSEDWTARFFDIENDAVTKWARFWSIPTDASDPYGYAIKVSCLNGWGGLDAFGNSYKSGAMSKSSYSALSGDYLTSNYCSYGSRVYQVLLCLLLPYGWSFSISKYDVYGTNYQQPSIGELQGSGCMSGIEGYCFNTSWTDTNDISHFGTSINGRLVSLSNKSGDIIIYEMSGETKNSVHGGEHSDIYTDYVRVPTASNMMAEDSPILWFTPYFRTLNDTTINMSIVPGIEALSENYSYTYPGILGFREYNCYSGAVVVSRASRITDINPIFYEPPKEWFGNTEYSNTYGTPSEYYGLPLGRFIVESCDKQADMKVRNLIGYSPDIITNDLSNDHFNSFLKFKFNLKFDTSFNMYSTLEYLLHSTDIHYWDAFNLYRVPSSATSISNENLDTISYYLGGASFMPGVVTAFCYGFADYTLVGGNWGGKYTSTNEELNTTYAVCAVVDGQTNLPRAAYSYVSINMSKYDFSEIGDLAYISKIEEDIDFKELINTAITSIISETITWISANLPSTYVIPTDFSKFSTDDTGQRAVFSNYNYKLLYEESLRYYLEEQLLTDLNHYAYLLCKDISSSTYKIEKSQVLQFGSDSNDIYYMQSIILPWSEINIFTRMVEFASKAQYNGTSPYNDTIIKERTVSSNYAAYSLISPDKVVQVFRIDTGNNRESTTNFIVDTSHTQIIDSKITITPSLVNSNYTFLTSVINLDISSLLIAYCELNGLFIRVNRYGEYETYEITKLIGLYPDETLYPASDLYPSGADVVINPSLYETAWYDDDAVSEKYYKVKYNDIESIIEDDATLTIYDLSSNAILSGKTLDDVETEIVTNLVDSLAEKIKLLKYMPADIDLKGLPYIEAGDQIEVITRLDAIDTVIMKRTLKGIQSLTDNYEST